MHNVQSFSCSLILDTFFLMIFKEAWEISAAVGILEIYR